ncbi:protein maelstrom-like [Macrobrachium nipponense]|uniref:protein maelstrom-like n=1 Tax=Macrobrachium nipponense TaxID=159736 RepID=UPI0030C7EFD6
MGKNKSQNEFFFYMVAMKPEVEKRLGKKVPMKEMASLVHADWKNLSEAEKQPYKVMSREAKGSAEKKDCFGVPLSVLHRKEEEKRKKEGDMFKDIGNTIQFHRDGGALHHHRIFVISTSEYCRTEIGSVPAELSVLCFTFNKGIEREHHVIFKANIPACYAYTAREESESTHCLLDGNVGVTDLEEVLHGLMQFLLEDLDELPPVYTLEELRGMTEEVLISICGGSLDFKVYSLDYYFQSMYSAALEHKIPMSIATDQLTNCALDYHPSMPCNWHSLHQKDAGKYCTLSCARRWVFNMCDHINITNTFGIEPIEGKHLPRKYFPEGTLIDDPRPLVGEWKSVTPQESLFVSSKSSESSLLPLGSSFQPKNPHPSSLASLKSREPVHKPNANNWSKVVSSTPSHKAASVTSGCSSTLDDTSDDDFPALGAGYAKGDSKSQHRLGVLGGAGRGILRNPEYEVKDAKGDESQPRVAAFGGIGRGLFAQINSDRKTADKKGIGHGLVDGKSLPCTPGNRKERWGNTLVD